MQDAADSEAQKERLMRPPAASRAPTSVFQVIVPKEGRNLCFIPARYFVAVMSGIGLAIIYGLKVNLSVCIVTMVNNTYVASETADEGSAHSGSECPDEASHAVDEDGPFAWTEPQQGLLLGSYFWGYMVSELPGGRLAEDYSAKWVMAASVGINLLGSLVSPVAAFTHYYVFVAVRVAQGLGGGLSFPAMHVIISHWAPPNDRALITAIIYAGTALGTVISFPMSGVIAAALGWEWVFYIMGILSAVWLVLWIILIGETPEDQKFITEEERNMIQDAIGDRGHHGKYKVPWKAMFTSMPFYSILVAHFCGNVGWYMLLTQLPTYMKHILHFTIKKNAGLSALPYFCMWLFTIALGEILEKLKHKEIISQTTVRKIATGIASLGGGACLVAVSYVGCDKTSAVALMVLAVTFMGSMFVGYLGNHIDVAHHFAGTMMAITNTVATIPGITVPVIVGVLTEGNQTIAQWRNIFFGTAAINVFYFIFYMIFGSGEQQEWDKIE